MKKIFLIIIIVIILLAFRDINNTYNKLYTKVEDEIVYIDELYTYGRYLNIKGHSNFELNNPELILLNNKLDEKNYKLNSNENFFYITDKINDGINLETINESYTILIKNNEKFYTLKNETNYQETEYYSLSKQNKTNHITLLFETFKDKPFLKLKLKNIDTPDNIYDIVIDPGHGGGDVGAVNGNIYESNINLSISLKLKQKLKNNGFKVKLTRENNTNISPYGKQGRATLPYETKAKLFLSVHVNSAPSSIIKGGIEVYAAPNMNYDFAYNIADKIRQYANTTFSPLQTYKIKNGVYVKTLSNYDIESSKKEAKQNVYKYYENITTNTPWYFYNRETGGYMTGAYMDGRNKAYPKNDYYNSNMGIESYLLELGYINCKNDFNNLLNNQDGYVTGIVKALTENLK